MRDYSWKLRLFNEFAERELRAAISELGLRPGMRVIDAGCGSGGALAWLAEAVDASVAHGTRGEVIGLELSAAHAAAARIACGPEIAVVQGDVTRPPLAERSFDLIWTMNTVNHLRDPIAGLRSLGSLLKRGGRIALGQSSLLPDMYFAWNARLEHATNAAVRRYYCERYGLTERDLASIRSLLGPLLEAGLRNVAVRTFVIERIQPLARADEAYLLEVIFRGTWGERLAPYLPRADRAALDKLCDPASAEFALRRPDFHFLQTFTLAVGETAN
ncbi:MAG: class I SAM-dependent methyltransferase [Steroidobacteraceae bacterium]